MAKAKPEEYLGQRIEHAELVKDGHDDKLRLRLANGLTIDVFDDGQSCCEARSMTTDDDVSVLVGGVLRAIDEKPGPTEDHDYDTHETCFVEVRTDDAQVTLVNHNEHNGYYGGFYVRVTVHAD